MGRECVHVCVVVVGGEGCVCMCVWEGGGGCIHHQEEIYIIKSLSCPEPYMYKYML